MKFGFVMLMCCCHILTLHAQSQRLVELKAQHLAYSPTAYYVGNVVEDRKDNTLAGRMNNSGKIVKVDLKNGAAHALTEFITKYVTQDRTKQMITIHITRLNFEMKKVNGAWTTDADISMAYYAGDTKLVDLGSKGQKQGDEDPLYYVDEFIRRVLESDLKKFDTWWQANGKRVPTSHKVKVIAKLGNKAGRPNCIVYSKSRPLAIADFEGAPENNIQEMAATLSGIGLESSAVTENGQIVLTILLTPYFSKSGSWFRSEGKNSRVLAHEQTHFDITAIKACELVNKLNNASFSKESYEAEIQSMMNKNAEETNKVEALFDTETNHGLIRDKEEEWERATAEKLKAPGCY